MLGTQSPRLPREGTPDACVPANNKAGRNSWLSAPLKRILESKARGNPRIMQKLSAP